ncbi:hypothetical protein SBV1_460010 [Verrucomicrobia bacterium]|nr:hypothetical protein SBV1_460010 [Verrucomicrobiota bacterium]
MPRLSGGGEPGGAGVNAGVPNCSRKASSSRFQKPSLALVPMGVPAAVVGGALVLGAAAAAFGAFVGAAASSAKATEARLINPAEAKATVHLLICVFIVFFSTYFVSPDLSVIFRCPFVVDSSVRFVGHALRLGGLAIPIPASRERAWRTEHRLGLAGPVIKGSSEATKVI